MSEDRETGSNFRSPSDGQRPAQELLIYPDGRVVAVQARPREPEPRRQGIYKQVAWSIGLFIATCLSTFYVGDWRYSNGWGYMLPVMAILLAHEMGHYLTSLWYRVSVSLPFFIPMPFSPLGTFGAVIVRHAGSREDRKTLFDIAIAGPLAGLVVAIPVCIYGAMTAVPVPFADVPAGQLQFAAPPVLRWIVYSVRGDWPAGHVLESAILDAGWVGIFITGLNLIPIGQLDGGHILYTLIRRRAHQVAFGLIIGAMTYMLWTGNATFMLMLFLILMMGPYHPPTSNDHVPLGTFRIVLGWLTLSFILISFTPTPIMMFHG